MHVSTPSTNDSFLVVIRSARVHRVLVFNLTGHRAPKPLLMLLKVVDGHACTGLWVHSSVHGSTVMLLGACPPSTPQAGNFHSVIFCPNIASHTQGNSAGEMKCSLRL